MTQQPEQAADRSARTGRHSFFDFSPVDTLLRRGMPTPAAVPRQAGIVPPTAEEARAPERYDHRYSLAELREIRADRPGYEPPTLQPRTVPGKRPLAQGTRVVVTGPRLPPDREETIEFLNGLKDVIPDLVLVHGGEAGTESLTDEWARGNDVPQIVCPAHPDGETAELRDARYEALIDATGPSRFYDLSTPDRPSRLAEIARQRHKPVIRQRILMERWAVRGATYVDLNQPGSRVIVTGPGSSADPEALSGVLDRLKKSIPDLVLVHRNLPGVERMTGEWAQENRVPQVILSPKPREGPKHEEARVNAMFHREPVRIYDFSLPGRTSPIAQQARARGLPVARAHGAIEPATAASVHAETRSDMAPALDARDRNMAVRARISHSR